ncbi:hypothetical protein C8250_019390 [Streptomyces sp. So13.3]|uniref:hypothetical protein n=1 Tax=Streptomyces TaxID=1883 RepID=UPI0011068D7A|nr:MULTISPECIES: hypothetical protein [Streptomyces]MCZ4095749.1 hypothetical protein [Streptomyces sp. H39-C1]QNA73794.1 hypothetical protein C8250_019390 [Streptomyces sp. So13.3]
MAEPGDPLVEAALRVTVSGLDLAAADRFDRELSAARQEAERTGSAAALESFLHRWRVFIALRRRPDDPGET